MAASDPSLPPLPGEPAWQAVAHPSKGRKEPVPLWGRFPTNLETVVLLTLITALGAFLRFWRLDYQAYWTDEGHTIERITGTFPFLLSTLTAHGFPPGWYSLLRWWRLAAESLSGSVIWSYHPACLRMLPAFFGTLMVPAMYHLARQFTDRRGALLVMLLAAVNPFLIYYSRDIKMYSALYCLVTINSAFFFHWLSSRRHFTLFPLYILSGAMMTAMHVMGWVMVGLHLVFLLTRPRPRPADGPLFVLAAGVMSWLPLYWFWEYLRPAQWSGRLAAGVDHGLGWMQRYTDMSWQTLAGMPTTHILGFLWPVYPPDARITDWFLLGNDFADHLATRSNPMLAQAQFYAAVALLAILFTGLTPWRWLYEVRRPATAERRNSSTRSRWWWVGLWIALPMAGLALTWIPQDSPWYARIWGTLGFNPKPLWEPRYLGIIVPAWLLWLGASLRRMPLLPLRALVILAVTAACTLSALSNHLIYRNPPFHRVAQLFVEYGGKDRPQSVAVAIPEVNYPNSVINQCVLVARQIVPDSPADKGYVAYTSPRRQPGQGWFLAPPNDPAVLVNWVRTAGGLASINAIIVTDKHGDITDPEFILSDRSLAAVLGTRWKLVEQESYNWHYEWRFYIHHTWRTRVWQREPVP